MSIPSADLFVKSGIPFTLSHMADAETALSLPLNDQQLRFCRHYAATMDARQAALLAGYKDRAAGKRLLQDPRVRAQCETLIRPKLAAHGVTKQRVLSRLADIGFSDVRELFDRDTGRLKSPADLSDAAAAGLAGIKVQRTRTIVPDGGPDGAYIEESIIEVKRIDPVAALSVLAKHTGIVGDSGSRIDGTLDAAIVPLSPETIASLPDDVLDKLATAAAAMTAPQQKPVTPAESVE
jgi:hypothetical protein